MSALADLRRVLQTPLMRIGAVIGLLAYVARLEITGRAGVIDADLWWHLRVGDWIVQHHAWPRTGIFSRTAADQPWAAYSWGFELVVSRLYHWFGLIGLGLGATLLVLLIIYTLFWMLRRLSAAFWASLGLTAAGTWAFYHTTFPRPVLFTMLFFLVELTVLFEARRRGSLRQAFCWLPLLFVLWSNAHIQFVYGLAVLGIFVGASWLQQIGGQLRFGWLQLPEKRLPPVQLWLLPVACLAATLIGPYSIRLYRIVFNYASSSVAYSIIRELQPVDFRSSAHYLELLIMAGGFLALGWKKKVDLFPLTLLVVASVVGFRTRRDTWFLCMTALAVIADALRRNTDEEKQPLWQPLAVWAGVALLMVAMVRNYRYDLNALEQAIATLMPVQATEYVKQHQLPGPIYNSLSFGGYLIWRLPDYPVSIDGRNDLYGDAVDAHYWEVLNAHPQWSEDPDIANANTLILENNYPLDKALAADPRFELVFADHIAAVFVRRR